MVGSIGFRNGDLVAKNITFDYTTNPQPGQPGVITADGQLLIGSVTTTPNIAMSAGNLLAGTGVTVTYTYPNITIGLTGGAAAVEKFSVDTGSSPVVPSAGQVNVLGLSGSKTVGSTNTITIKSPPFSQVGASAVSSLNTGEFVTAAVTRTLPASAGLADGDLFVYVCTTASALVVQAVGTQKIRLGNSITSEAGSVTSTAIGDSITLRFNATDGFFYTTSAVGNWTLT